MPNVSKKTRIAVDLPPALYRQFAGSKLRQHCASDMEAIRHAIRTMLSAEQEHAPRGAVNCEHGSPPAQQAG